ncbi:P-loop containing nucleoside triphosphate hydrolase [Pseudocohnilembus persalinus]|uniref:p-loop containing nucleoside triphosphate hydrolase n=1 Tax=Pseudocohnilembus persalinus TaxID=266149 RepID=A0A0V0QYF0_PSEPJ|nr:P-loop containing nucleoside triphosphate hydrolase [Pseudocohnilembus persalinus]|eukprot:KRX07286.1 P-loop containing nucleoside triphosphate hydrolase [Pseudocohnilembus persalinus]
MTFDGIQTALWDLSGQEEFVNLWDIFLEVVPFKTLMIFIRPYAAGNQLNIGGISQTRKILHQYVNDIKTKNKIIFLIINVQSQYDEYDSGEGTKMGKAARQKENEKLLLQTSALDNEIEKNNKIKSLIEELLNWNDVPQQKKQSIVLDVSNYGYYDNFWREQLKMYKELQYEYKSQQQNKSTDNNQDKLFAESEGNLLQLNNQDQINLQ